MKLFLNRFAVFVLALLLFMNFYIAPKSIVAYNTKNLTSMNVVAKNYIVKSVSGN